MLILCYNNVMKFELLKQSLKKSIEHSYKLVGDDNFLISKSIELIKSQAVDCFEEFNVQVIDEQISLNQLQFSLETLPMMAKRRFLIFKYLENSYLKLLNDAIKYEHIVKVFVNPTISVDGVLVECSDVSNELCQKFILNEIAKFDISIEKNAIDTILKLTNNKLGVIKQECDKLISYARTKKTITTDDVKNIVIPSEEYYVYTLSNKIDEKDLENMSSVLNVLLKSMDAINIFKFLGSYFRRMFLMCLTNNDNEIISIFKNLKSFAIKKARHYILLNGKNFYINRYIKFVDLDFMIVSGKISAINALYEILFFN